MDFWLVNPPIEPMINNVDFPFNQEILFDVVFVLKKGSSGACPTVHLSHRLSSRACATNGLVFFREFLQENHGNPHRNHMKYPLVN